MDIQPQSQQPISDDQELAKVLAGVKDDEPTEEGQPETDTPAPMVPNTPMPTAEDVAAATAAEEAAKASATATPEPSAEDTSVTPMTMPDPIAMATPPATDPIAPMSPVLPGSDDLGEIKQEAIVELRPLVDKLNLSPEEKFDTYLLILRSTDDKTLVGPAHEAAKNIVDEERKAKALLEIIKEIDFLSQGN